MKFTKMHGCGNDYIYINCFEESVTDAPTLSKRLSDRHFGIGGDGIVLICPSDKADFFMDMYNLDGSRGKMCGNAIRCVGKYVYDNKMTDSVKLDIETLSGIKHLKLNLGKDGKVESVRVDMGSPIVDPGKIPLNTELLSGMETVRNEDGAVLKMSLSHSAGSMDFTAVSMGNPHAVTYIEDVPGFDIEKWGPDFETHGMFPEQANIEFVHVIDRDHIEFRVWERGSGETFACGTGACASVYACIINGLTNDKVNVKMRGGELVIEYDRTAGTIYMTGPATVVFNGEVSE